MSKPLTPEDDDALAYLYGGDCDVEIECHSAAWVVIRYSHECLSVLHKGKSTIPAGSNMILERAKVDGRFGSSYTCVSCIEAARNELNRH
jgi:hypothetical protein